MSEAKRTGYGRYVFFGKQFNWLLQKMSNFDMIATKGNQSEAASPSRLGSEGIDIPPDENERRDSDDYIF